MYVDESGSPGLRFGRYFVISGIIVNESNLDDISIAITNYRLQNFKNEYKNAEIHIYNIWQNQPPFNRINFETKKTLLDKLYNRLSELPFIVVSVVIDKKLILANPLNNWNVKKASWTFLTERFDMYIAEVSSPGIKGVIIIDTNTKEVDNETRIMINDLRENGSNFHNYKRLFEEPLFVPSYNRNLLQVADAVSYCTLKHFQSVSTFESYWKLMETKYRKNPTTKKILRYGLKIFPEINEGETT